MTVEEVLTALNADWRKSREQILTEAKAEWELEQRERCWADIEEKCLIYIVHRDREKKIKDAVMNAVAKEKSHE